MYKIKKNSNQIINILLVLVMFISLLGFAHIGGVSAVDEVNANITFTSQIVKNTGTTETIESVSSGEPFFLAVKYNVNSGGDNVRYQGCNVSIVLPALVEFDELAITAGSSTVFNKATTSTSFGRTIVEIAANGTLESGNAGTIYLKMHFKNLETPNNTTVFFDQMSMTGTQVIGSTSTPLRKLEIPSVEMTATANQEWNITKKVASQSGQNETIVIENGKKYYLINYEVGISPVGDGNRYGRLNCEKFDVVDILPTQYPVGGGATELLVSVGNKKLIEGTDYEIEKNTDNSIKLIKFKYVSTYKSDGTSTDYVPDGTPVSTTYTVSVKYPYAAYEVDHDRDLELEKKILDNKATLVYKPIGEKEVTLNANASNRLGWQEKDPKKVDLVVTKKVTINASGIPSIGVNDTQIMDKNLQDIYYKNSVPVKFGLYTDQECTQLVKGSDITAIDAQGQVKFNNIYFGTYYLKEVQAPAGFLSTSIKKIEISREDGSISVDGVKLSNNNVDFINTTDKDGYGYVAFFKRGSSATQADAGWLPGVKFTLTYKSDTSKIYEATSNENGLVLFAGIPAGEYTISENNSDGEFEVNTSTWDITVIGNKVNYPTTMDIYKDKGINYPYVLNKSSKGKFKIVKKDSINNTVLDGATFEVYVPKDLSKQWSDIELLTFNPTDIDVVEDSFQIGGNQESGALLPGYYVYKEINAPNGYTLDSRYKVLHVTQNHLEEVEFLNVPQGKLEVFKYGVISETIQIGIPIDGSEFTVYCDKKCTQEVGTKIRPYIDKATGKAACDFIYLDAGAYYLKETTTPAGYKPNANVIEFNVTVGQTTEVEVHNTVSQKGQLEIVKKDSKTNALLKGAVFEIYKDGEINALERLITNDNGYAISEFLTSGNYYLKEVTAPTGHAPIVNQIAFSIQDNTITKLETEIKNDPLVNYQLKKVNSLTDVVMSGVQFNLYNIDPDTNNSASFRSFTSNASGLVTFTGLIPGKTYYYREAKTNNNFTLDKKTYSFVAPMVVSTDDKLLPITGPTVFKNDPQGRLFVEKTFIDFDGTEKPLQLIRFMFYPKISTDYMADMQEAKKAGTYKSLGTTDNTGNITSGYVDKGEYWVEEVANANYKPLNPQSVIVESGKIIKDQTNVAKFKNEYVVGKFVIEKVSSVLDNNGKPIAVVAKFKLYKYVEGLTDYSGKNIIQTITTTNGKFESGLLAAGDYALIEDELDGYVIDKRVRKITIEAGKINNVYTGNDAIVNIPTSTLILKKYETWNSITDETNLPAAGFKFDVYHAVECLSSDSDAILYNGKFYKRDGNSVTSLTSATNSVSKDGLTPGMYIVKEELSNSQKVAGYTEAPPQVVELKDAQSSLVTFKNRNSQSKIKVTKVDAADHDIKLNDAVFEIYRLKEATDTSYSTIFIDDISYDVCAIPFNYMIVSGTAIMVDKDGNEINENGVGYSGFLAPGKTYFLKETSSPNGYKMSQEWTKVGTLVAGELSEVTIENYKPVQVIGNKKNGLDESVSGAIFGLFETKEAAEHVRSMSQGEINRLINDEKFQKENGVLQICSANNQGEIIFEDINQSREYFVYEILPPSGFEHNTKIYNVKISQDGNRYIMIDKETNDILTIINYEHQRIWIKKEFDFGGEKKPLNGVTFFIYDAVESTVEKYDIEVNGKYYKKGDMVDNLLTGTDSSAGTGAASSKRLPAGNYILEEDEKSLPKDQGIIVDTSNKYHFVTLTHVDASDKVVNKVYYDNPILNRSKYGSFYLDKVSNIADKKLVASFELQVKTDNGYIQYINENKQTVNVTTDGTNIFKLNILLPAGDYRLVEKSVEFGYTLNSTPIDFQIIAEKITGMANGAIVYYDKASDAETHPIKVVNNAQGRVTLNKKGNQITGKNVLENVNLSGVTFDLFKKILDNGKLVFDSSTQVGTATSDVNGKLIFKNKAGDIMNDNQNWLDVGGYILKETSVGQLTNQGYVANYLGQFEIVSNTQTNQIITVGEDGVTSGTASSSIMNESLYGKFKIKKQDLYQLNNADKSLAGVKFDIYKKDENNRYTLVNDSEMITDSNGEAISKLLPEGEYYVKEKSTLDGYYLDESYFGPYTVTKQTVNVDTNYIIKNKMKQSILVYKVDALNKDISADKMVGTTFELYDATKALLETQVYNETSQTIRFDSLQPDTIYYLKEKVAPKGYQLRTDYIEVKTGKTQTDSSSAVVTTIDVQNELLGILKIEKKAKWEMSSTSNTQLLPLMGVEFTLYKANSDGTRGEVVAVELTGKDGTLLFEGLDSGNYKLLETKVLDGFAENDTVYDIVIENGKVNEVYTGTNAIVNVPDLGKFEFKKTKADGTVLQGAKFELRDSSDKIVSGFNDFTVDKDGEFSSAMLEPGDYKLIEKSAPSGYTVIKPIEFTIVAKQIVTLTTNGKTLVDDAQGSIEITKYNNVSDYTTTNNQVLSGVYFGLYKGDGTLVKEAVTNASGKIKWTNVNPGDYYVQEIKTDKNPDGYQYSDTRYSVTIKTNESAEVIYHPSGTTGGEIINVSTKGRLVIKKTDTNSSNPIENLAGAVFKVYKVLGNDSKGDYVCDITIGNNGYGISELLEVGKDGIEYFIEEIKAPKGYILDDSINKITGIVKVYPVQDSQLIIGNKVKDKANIIEFKNTKILDMMNFETGIKKGLTTAMNLEESANDSLSNKPYSTLFAIRDFAKGKNTVKANHISVSDTEIKYEYYDSQQGKYVEDTSIDGESYIVNSVKIYSSYNQKLVNSNYVLDSSKKVNAQVYYQSYNSSWNKVPNGYFENIQNIGNTTKTVSIDKSLKAMHVKVEYTGVEENFVSNGFDISATFNKRPSSSDLHEIRRIVNNADVDYEFVVKDNTGTDIVQNISKQSNDVRILFPTLEEKTPTVKIGVVATDVDGAKKATFKPGDSVQYNITVQNVSQNNADFESPIVSFDLPIGMSLNDRYSSDASVTDRFKVVLGTIDEDGIMNGKTIDLNDLIFTYTPVGKARIVKDGELIETDSPTMKVTMRFADERIIQAGNSLRITLAGAISNNETNTSLWMPTYLNSEKKISLSKENPYGNSFSVNVPDGNSNPLVNDKVLDDVLSNDDIGGNKFANSNTDVTVNENNSLSIFKQVKGVHDSQYLDYNQIGQTSPDGSIDYNIQATNGEDSDRAVNKMRIVDLLPFEGDSLVGRDNADDKVTPRSTGLNRDAILNSVSYSNQPTGSIVTIYYCIDSKDMDKKWDKWKRDVRNSIPAKQELPMLYDSMSDAVWNQSDAGHTWYKSTSVDSSELKYVSAVAVEITCQDGNYINKGDKINVHINITAPLYGTEEVDLYENKLIANSAMVAVGRVGNTDQIINSDRTENNEVKVKLTLPKGLIGDYAFYDINHDGIQNFGDTPIKGLKVTLHQLKTTLVNGKKVTQKTLRTTQTDDAGYYQFDNLDCNVPKIGKSKDSLDPTDFASEAYFEYQVEFSLPDDQSRYRYVPTQRYVGNDKLDSNIGNDPLAADYLKTEIIRLTATKNENAFIGESNQTLDAGFNALGALGNFVWFDENRNGVQDEDEVGINDVVVNLYSVKANGTVDQKIASTLTSTIYGKDGYYMFERLLPDQYIIEFDVSNVSPGGYTQKYAFTESYKGFNNENDSNAVNKISSTVMRSDVVRLGNRGYDISIDAGLTVHSAIGGLAFEDRNYSDMQDFNDGIDVVVPGTIVELYSIDEIDGTRNPDAIAMQIVGEDGKYFFGNLIEGQYQVKFTFPEEYKIINANVGNDNEDNDIEYELNNNRNSGFTDIIAIPQNTLVENVDGGACRYSQLGDYVWLDLNKNGIQDEVGKGIANVPVYLQMKTSDDSGWEQIASTVTDDLGYYVFKDLKSSDYGTGIKYRVLFDLPLTTKLTLLNKGESHLDSNALSQYIPGFGYPTDEIILGYNKIDLTWDAGIIESQGAVGDYVWIDTNQNGIQDEKDTGLKNISVVLEYNESEDLSDENNWKIVGETQTNKLGYYIFTGLKSGMYRVRFQIDKPYYVTLSNMGEDAGLDSDGVTLFEKNWYYGRAFYLNEEGYDMTWDCGVYVPQNGLIGNGNGENGTIKTNDDNDIVIYIILAGVALTGFSITLFVSKKKKQKPDNN